MDFFETTARTKPGEKPLVAITHGDINGISYEIILKTLKDPRILDFFIPVIYGSPKVAAYYKKVMKMSSITLNHIKKIEEAEEGVVNIINTVSNKVRVEIGKSTETAGISSINALKHALVDIREGKVEILVTAPINKHNVQNIDFNFKGHTDFLKNEFQVDEVVMFMIYENLRVGLVTEHLPLSEVPRAITPEKIVSKLKLMDKTLRQDFHISRPMIAVLGLNPHCGDNGLLGKEEEEIILPAIEQAKEEGIMAIGPYSADGFFGSGSYMKFDAVLAMYHDQGLTPFKAISQNKGVNFTAGLPIVRTSPDHGVAYDIAGKNQANPLSFRNAIYLALDIYKKRKASQQIKPLEKQEVISNETDIEE